jgi:hypothetical protein
MVVDGWTEEEVGPPVARIGRQLSAQTFKTGVLNLSYARAED